MLLGCAQKDNSEPQPEGFKRTVQVTFTKGADTKTAIVEGEDRASYVWTEGDEQYFKVWENTTPGTNISASYSSDMKKATLTVTFNTASASEYVYKAIFAKGISSSNNLEIQANQNPTATSYDPSADAMYADDITSPSAKTSLEFILHRAITVNKMTLKGMTAGEKVGKVEITFNKNVTGYFNPSSGDYSLNGKKISLSYPSLEVGDNGEFPVYFTSAPCEGLALTSVVVYTDQNSYNRTDFSKTYNFSIGKMVRFGINMAGTATPVTSSDVYTKVTNSTDLTPGTYIIAAASLDFAMGSLSNTSTKYHLSESITKVGNTISLDNASPVLILELAQSGSSWTMKNIKEGDSNNGKYIAWTSGNTSTEQSDPYNWTISVSNGVATIKNPSPYDSYVLLYNQSSPRFACYTSSQQPIALYKKTGGAKPVGISFEHEAYTFKYGSSDYNSFTGQTVTKEESDDRVVSYEILGSIGSIDSSTGIVTLNGTMGTATVTATVGADATHAAGTVSYTITVIESVDDCDILDNAFIGVTDNNYANNSGLDGSSGRGSVYSTNSAGSYSSIQLRTNNSNSGIVTTASGGNVSKIVVEWNSNTANGRSLQVYGKNSAYSLPSDLYNSSNQGTLIGTIVCGTSTELLVTNDFQYIGLRSANGAIYLDEIRVYWTDGSPSTTPAIVVTSANPITVGKEGGSKTITYNITHPVSGVSLTASTNVSWITGITYGSSSVSFNVDAQASGASSRYGEITLNYSGATSVIVSVSQEAGEGGAQAAYGWLELPAKQTGSDFHSNHFKISGARNYSYLYQFSTYTCLWVAYPMYPSIVGGSSSSSTQVLGPYYPTESSDEELRRDWYFNPHFSSDLQVNVCKRSYGVDVGNTIYARGHQIANADRNGNSSMQDQTYYVTNSTPQIQNSFNSGIWSSREDGVRSEMGSDTIYVVTGATFNKIGETKEIKYINPQDDLDKDVPVPNYYWKVILKVKRSGGNITSAMAVGVWLEHKQYSSTSYTSYTFSVDKIEEWTGFDFFVNLPDEVEATAEANSNWDTFHNF